MLSANWIRHLKVLGKICYLYDQAETSTAALRLAFARLKDQAATGEVASIPASEVLDPKTSLFFNAVAAGPTAIKSICKDMAAAYLTSSDFRGDLTATPTTASSAKSVLEAVITELGTDVSTFTTAASTGLVNFFETEWAPTGSFPQASPGTYPDATYVVVGIVA